MENKYNIFIIKCCYNGEGKARILNHFLSTIGSKDEFIPLFVFLWPSYGVSEMARNGFEDGSKIYAYINIGVRNYQVSFVVPRTYVRNYMKK